MMPWEKTKVLVNALMRHQEHCGILKQSEDGKEVVCTGCGARVTKKDGGAIIETEDLKIGIL